MKFSNHISATWLRQTFNPHRIQADISQNGFRIGLILLASFCIGLAVIISTYYINNVKLLIGLVGGIAYVLVTMRWPEFSILSLVALLSGLISLSWLPLLHLGPISLNISDVMLMVLLGLVFLRATTQRSFKLYGSPLMLPLFLFIAAFLFSAAYAVLFQGVNANTVLRTIRVLSLWIIFFPTLQLIRDERALRRFLNGILILAAVLLIGVLFPNKLEPLLYIEERAAGTGSEIYSDIRRVYYAGDMVLYAMIPVTMAALAMIKKGNQLWRIGFLGLLLFWLFRTFFRQYWLTIFVTCILLLWFLTSRDRLRLIKRMAPAIIIGILLLAIFSFTYPTKIERIVYIMTDRLGSLLNDPLRNEGSLQWRAIETRAALDQIYRHPILGIGLANSYRTPMAGEADDMYSGWAYKYVENGYLYIAVMMGLAGLLPFLWLCMAYLIRVFQHQSEIRDENLRSIYLGFGAAFLGMVACNLASPTFVIGTRLIFFPVAMATSEIILRIEREKKAQ
jgi:O-antigen ligase